MDTTLKPTPVIDASKIGATNALTIAPKVQPTPTDTTGIVAQMASELATTQATVASQEKALSQSGSSMTALSNQIGGKKNDLLSQEQAQGAEQARIDQTNFASQLADLNAQSMALARQSQIDTMQNQNNAIGTGRTQGQVENINSQNLRNTAIKQLVLGQQADLANAALTGSTVRLQAAKDKASQIVDAQYAPIEAQLAAEKENFARNKDVLTRLDAKSARALEMAIKQDESRIATEREQKKEISKMLVEASQNAPADVLERAKKISENGGSLMAVAQALGQFGGDYLKNQLLKEQIKKVRAESLQINTKISSLRQGSTGLISAPNGDSLSSLPSSTLLNIGKMKLNEGQANAVAFVTRMVQSDQAINRQLSANYDPTTISSGVGRLVSSDASRDYNRNAEDFIRAQLRKESGAAIPEQEIEGAKKLYVASGFGQDEKDIKQAAIKRDTAIKSMIAQAGPASVQMLQYYEEVKAGSGTILSQNPQLNAWYSQTSRAANTSTTAATAGFGFTDNQLK